jgi:hypothetical protein
LNAWDPTGDKANSINARYAGVCRGCGAYAQPPNGNARRYHKPCLVFNARTSVSRPHNPVRS